MKEYHAGNNNTWQYFGIDEAPPSTGKVHILTEGGQSILGNRNTVGAIAWAPLMKRDREKEALLVKYKNDPVGLKKAATALQESRNTIEEPAPKTTAMGLPAKLASPSLLNSRPQDHYVREVQEFVSKHSDSPHIIACLTLKAVEQITEYLVRVCGLTVGVLTNSYPHDSQLPSAPRYISDEVHISDEVLQSLECRWANTPKLRDKVAGGFESKDETGNYPVDVLIGTAMNIMEGWYTLRPGVMLSASYPLSPRAADQFASRIRGDDTYIKSPRPACVFISARHLAKKKVDEKG